MEIFVKNTDNLGITSRITDIELMVLLQANERGLVRSAKVLVDFHGEPRYLDIEAIDRERTLPGVVFAGYTVPPPPAPARTQAAELRKRPHRGVFPCPRGDRLCPDQRPVRRDELRRADGFRDRADLWGLLHRLDAADDKAAGVAEPLPYRLSRLAAEFLDGGPGVRIEGRDAREDAWHMASILGPTAGS